MKEHRDEGTRQKPGFSRKVRDNGTYIEWVSPQRQPRSGERKKFKSSTLTKSATSAPLTGLLMFVGVASGIFVLWFSRMAGVSSEAV